MATIFRAPNFFRNWRKPYPDTSVTAKTIFVAPFPGYYAPLSVPTRRAGLPIAVLASAGCLYATPPLPGPATGLASTVLGNAPQVKTFLYPSVQEPVPIVAAAEAETVTIDKWHSPLSQPTRIRGSAPVGEFLAYVPLPATSIGWYAPISEPTRRVTTRNGDFFWSGHTPAPTTLAWHPETSQPVRRTGLTTDRQQATAFVPVVESDATNGWNVSISQPTYRKRLAEYPSFSWSGHTPAEETVTLDKWFSPPGQPQFKPPRQYQPDFWSGHTPAPETITLDKWFSPPGQPQFRVTTFLFPAIHWPVPIVDVQPEAVASQRDADLPWRDPRPESPRRIIERESALQKAIAALHKVEDELEDDLPAPKVKRAAKAAVKELEAVAEAQGALLSDDMQRQLQLVIIELRFAAFQRPIDEILPQLATAQMALLAIEAELHDDEEAIVALLLAA